MLMTFYFAGLQNYNLFKFLDFLVLYIESIKKLLALNILPTNIYSMDLSLFSLKRYDINYVSFYFIPCELQESDTFTVCYFKVF